MLVKNAVALEQAEKIRTLIVDKTGTLTEGKPVVTDVLPAAGFSERDLVAVGGQPRIRLGASAGARGARACEAAWTSQLAPMRDFRSVTGKGVQAVLDVPALGGEQTLLLGAPAFLDGIRLRRRRRSGSRRWSSRARP